MTVVETTRMDRSAFDVASLDDDSHDREYWRSRTPAQRMEALELMRQIIYGYDPSTTRLQSVLEVADIE